MPFKLLTCDGLVAKDDRVYVTELCPPLSCTKCDVIPGCVDTLTIIYLKIMSKSKGFKIMQAPQEPAPHKNLLSHYARDAGNRPFTDYASGTIPKDKVREHLHKLVLKQEQAAVWVMYFRNNRESDAAERYALLLKKLMQRLKIDVEIIDAYPLSFVCEHDKVCFWQLLRTTGSSLLIPKEIFRFSTFNLQQKTKLAVFCKEIAGDKVIIKPTNSTLTNGILVVDATKVLNVIELIIKYLSSKTAAIFMPSITAELSESLKKIVYPEHVSEKSLADTILNMELKKFINYWLQLDKDFVLESERDFFLVEAFKAPKKFREPLIAKEISVASRFCFGYKDTVGAKPILFMTHAKRRYDPEKVGSEYHYIDSIPFTNNVYTREFIERNPTAITSYFPRNVDYNQKVATAFEQPSEREWRQLLIAMTLSDFLTRVRAENASNPELIQYLDSDTVQKLKLENTEFCWHCFKIATDLKRCSACSQAHYCSPDCQAQDWKNFHKKECKQLKP